MVSVSRMKALKRNRRNNFDGYNSAGVLPPGPHAPAKAESALLRHLCAKTGLTELQVREHKTYRRMLAEVAKPKPGKGEYFRRATRVRKAVAARTGLHPLHPEFMAAFEPAWQSAQGRHYYGAGAPLSAKEALELTMTHR